MTINNPYTPTVVLSSADMSADIASEAISFLGFKNLGVQFEWTGTPTGVLGVEVTGHNDPAGPYTALTLDTLNPPLNQPAGSAGSAWLDLDGINPTFIKITYARTSGSGFLTATVRATT